MLNNIVDNIQQCGQQNIVQSCFHQPRTGCSCFAVYVINICIAAIAIRESHCKNHKYMYAIVILWRLKTTANAVASVLQLQAILET